MIRTLLALWIAAAVAIGGCGDKGGGSAAPPAGGGGGGGGGPYAGSSGDGSDGASLTYPAPSTCPIVWLTTDPTTLAQEDIILDLVNNQRVSIGAGALTMILLMRQVSRGHSVHMTNAYHDFFAHTNPELDGPTQRYNTAGGPGGCGENIAAGYADANAAFVGWMNSPGHKANIENGGYTKTGTGYSPGVISAGPYTKVYTQMFQ